MLQYESYYDLPPNGRYKTKPGEALYQPTRSKINSSAYSYLSVREQ
jgi:hypothetical protein